MLLVDNGTFKSGSTWLGRIIRGLKLFERPPERFLSEAWKNPHIPPGKLRAFLLDCEIKETDYFVKAHYGKLATRNMLLGHSDVRVALITRDLRDVIVSAYFHYQRTSQLDQTFDKFFWTRGRLIAAKVLRYNQLWSVDSPRIFRTTYELLKADPWSELWRLSKFLEVRADEELIEQVVANTRFDKMKARDHSGHIRAGNTGGYSEYMNDSMIKELNRIESQGRLWLPLSFGLKVRDAARRYVQQISLTRKAGA